MRLWCVQCRNPRQESDLQVRNRVTVKRVAQTAQLHSDYLNCMCKLSRAIAMGRKVATESNWCSVVSLFFCHTASLCNVLFLLRPMSQFQGNTRQG